MQLGFETLIATSSSQRSILKLCWKSRNDMFASNICNLKKIVYYWFFPASAIMDVNRIRSAFIFPTIQHPHAYLKTPTPLNLLSYRYPHRAGIQHAGGRIRCHLAGKLELLPPFDCVIFHLLPAVGKKIRENESCIRLVHLFSSIIYESII